MQINTLDIRVQLPEGTEAAAKVLALQQRFVAMVRHSGGKATVSPLPPPIEALQIKRWIVDDCDTHASNGMDLLLALGNVADGTDNIFGNMVFEDAQGVIHKVITTYEILRIIDPTDRADLLRRFPTEIPQIEMAPSTAGIG